MKPAFSKNSAGELVLFRTHENFVYDSNGTPLSDKLKQINETISDKMEEVTIEVGATLTLASDATVVSAISNDAGTMVVLTSYGDSYYTTDGSTWNVISGVVPNNCFALTYGDGKFVGIKIVSDECYYSEDGITWTQSTMPSSSYWTGVIYGNGKYVAIAQTNKIAYSVDAINWIEATLPSEHPWRTIAFGNGKFVAVADDLAIAHSRDGVTWDVVTSIISEPTPSDYSFATIVFGSNKFVVVKSNSTDVMYSVDGINWLSTALDVDRVWTDCIYNGDKFLACALNSDAFMHSTDGISWEESTLPVSGNWYVIGHYSDGKDIIITSEGISYNILSVTTDSLTVLNEVKAKVSDLETKVAQGKANIAAAITEKGVETASDSTFAVLANGVKNIVTLTGGSADATAAAGHILAPYVAYGKDGVRLTGTIATTNAIAGPTAGGGYNQINASGITGGNISQTDNPDTPYLYLGVPGGTYLSGDVNWVRSPYSDVADTIGLTAAKLAKGQSACGISGTYTSDGTVSASHVLKDKVCYSNGSRIVGTIASKAAATYTPGTSNQVISSGVYLSGNQTIKGDSNLIAGNIKSGVSIFGVSGSLTVESLGGIVMKSVTKTYTLIDGKHTASGLTEEQIAGLQCIYNKTDNSYCYGPRGGYGGEDGIGSWYIGKPGDNSGIRFHTGDDSLAPGTIAPTSGSNAGTKTFVFYYI